jgi:outer membrane receptor protein involved in Fe transport
MTFRSYSSVDAFLLDAAQPFASSSIKQNLQYAQNTYDSKSCRWRDKGWKQTSWNVGQVAFYAQDDWNINDDFKLTLGLRADKPLYNTSDLIQKYIDTDNGLLEITIEIILILKQEIRLN